MNVLVITEFDPAGVMLSHREALLACTDLDMKVAVATAYTPRHRAADFVGGYAQSDGIDPGAVVGLKDAVKRADVLVLTPGIGQPWSSDDKLWFKQAGPDVPFGGLDDLISAVPRKVAYFHGSKFAWKYRHEYAAQYRRAGYALAASTLDYAVELSAAYLPPAMFDVLGRARLRRKDEAMRIIHCPTDVSVCNTGDLLKNAPFGAEVIVRTRIPYQQVIEEKLAVNAGFDHLRGAFSVNTLENCLFGLAPFCKLERRFTDRLIDEGYSTPPETIADTERAIWHSMEWYVNDWQAQGRVQIAAREWALANFSPRKIADRLSKFYRSLL